MTLPRSPPGSNSNADSHTAHCSSIVIGATLSTVSQTDHARQQAAALQSPRMLVATAMCKTKTHRAVHPGMHSSPPSPSSRGRSSMNSRSRMCPFIAVRSLLFCRQSRAGISLGLSAACRHTRQQDPLALQAAGFLDCRAVNCTTEGSADVARPQAQLRLQSGAMRQAVSCHGGRQTSAAR